MNWYEDVVDCARRGNKIWFRKTNELILDLSKQLESKSRKVVTIWALIMAADVRYHLSDSKFLDERIIEAIDKSAEWASGEGTMKSAKSAILACHAICKEDVSELDSLRCHAIAQACSTVHSRNHAIGLPMYDLTAIVKSRGLNNCEKDVINRMDAYKRRLKYSEEHIESFNKWADFIKD